MRGFRVSTWNVDSLMGRADELVEALADGEVDARCIQEIRWRGSGCRFFVARGIYIYMRWRAPDPRGRSKRTWKELCKKIAKHVI